MKENAVCMINIYVIKTFHIVCHKALALHDIQKKKSLPLPFLYLDSAELPYQVTDVCTDYYGLIVTRYSWCTSDLMNIWSRKDSVLRTQINKDPIRVRSLQGSPSLIKHTLRKMEGKQLESPSIWTLLDFLDQNLSTQESQSTFCMHCDQSFQPKSCEKSTKKILVTLDFKFPCLWRVSSHKALWVFILLK